MPTEGDLIRLAERIATLLGYPNSTTLDHLYTRLHDLKFNDSAFPADNFSNIPHYKSCAHNSIETVWTPATGKKMHLVTLIISTTLAGYLELYYNDGTDKLFARLEFNERFSAPFGIGTDLDFPIDATLKAKFVGDTGTPTAYVTAIGHEH